MSRNKIASAIALFLILSVAAFSTCLPIVKAEDIPTYAFIAASPNPVGVTQRVQITAWIDKMPPFRDMSLGSWSAYYSDITIEVTAPDGSKQTLGPQNSDPAGTTYFAYTPKEVGTYYFQMIYPGEDFTPGYGSSGNDVSGYYLASTSKKLEVTVQEEPIQFMPATPSNWLLAAPNIRRKLSMGFYGRKLAG